MMQNSYDDLPFGIIDDAPEVCDECDSGAVMAYRIFGGYKEHQRHTQGKKVYRNFPEAVAAFLSDFKDGTAPMEMPGGSRDGS